MADVPPTGIASDLMTVVTDQSLTDAARVIAVRLYAMGDDWHELSPDDFSRMVAGYPQRDTVRKHLRQLEMAGYVDRQAGGKGHSDRFRFDFSVGTESQPKNDRVGQESDPNVLASEPNPTLTPRSSSKQEVAAMEPPISPLPLSDAATKALDQHDDLLSGCRGALSDYLKASVPAPKQQPYVQSLATYLNGYGVQWQNGDGRTVPAAARTGLIAAALNELGAQDEVHMKNPVGDIRNLRTKLSILVRDYGREHVRPNGSSHGGSTSGKGRGKATGTDGRRAGFIYEE